MFGDQNRHGSISTSASSRYKSDPVGGRKRFISSSTSNEIEMDEEYYLMPKTRSLIKQSIDEENEGGSDIGLKRIPGGGNGLIYTSVISEEEDQNDSKFYKKI